TGKGALTDENVMDILLGFDKEKNPKEVRYFSGKQSSGSSASSATGGLFYTDSGSTSSAQLFDPWRKEGAGVRHYYLLLDLDYDEKIKDPTDGSYTIHGRQAAAWSTGQDGKDGGTNNRDNVYSWK
ncbi:MAG: hypothetical protein HKO57_14010, partial [Akkermansiaceae bacterium]|nr:hypothetical protein [Akkermansiaceae bacterium]